MRYVALAPLFLVAAHVTACDDSAADASDASATADDCHNGFPVEGEPCKGEGSQCTEEGPGPCSVGVLVCRSGVRVRASTGKPAGCSSSCADHHTGDSCSYGATCSGGGYSCTCSGSWRCNEPDAAIDGGPDSADAGPDAADAADAG